MIYGRKSGKNFTKRNNVTNIQTFIMAVPLWSSGQSSGYRSWGPGFDSRRYQIFREVVDLKRGTLSLVRIIEELLEWKSSGSGLGNRN
jgi:hypothetical protein